MSKRELLLEAATRCIAKRGVSDVTMEDIAAEAMVARITIYREFGNRKALVEALIAHRLEAFHERFATTEGQFEDLAGALEAYLLASIKTMRKSPITVEFVRGPMTFAKAGSTLHTVSAKLWVPWLEKARNVGQLAPGVDFNDAVEWILIMQHTLCRLAVDVKGNDQHYKVLVREFVAPAFLRR